MNNSNMIRFEFRNIYDGWIIEANRRTGEIKWRDIHVVDKISKPEKKRIEDYVKNSLTPDTA